MKQNRLSPEDKEFLARPRFSPLLKQSTHIRTVAFGGSLFGGDVCIFHPFRQPQRGLERMRSLSSYTQTCVLSEKAPPPLFRRATCFCADSAFFFFFEQLQPAAITRPTATGCPSDCVAARPFNVPGER